MAEPALSRGRARLLAVGAISLVACSTPVVPVPNRDAGLDPGPATSECPDAARIEPRTVGPCVVVQTRSFEHDVMPLFDGCAGEICHRFTAQEVLSQIGEPAEECCNEMQLIEPLHPERSYVLQKLIGRNLCMGSRMPLDRPPYGATDLQVLSDWICAGAQSTP